MDFSKLSPLHWKILSVLVFLVVSCIFCYPSFQGKVLYQDDIKHGKGSSSEISKYREEGRQILWTNTLFSGMPTTLISTHYKGELLDYIPKLFKSLPHPTGVIFMLMLGFYILLLTLKIDLRIALIGGLLYGLTSFYIISLAAGHNTKISTLAFLPGVFAGFIWLYSYRKILLGSALLMLFLSLAIQARHPQMVYYMFFVVFTYLLYEAVKYAEKNELRLYTKFSVIALGCLLIAFSANYAYLRNTSFYSQYSIRGKSAIAFDDNNAAKSGLSKDYITNWSYGISETLSLLIPNFKGGESTSIKDNIVISNDLSRAVSNHSQYWGDQPSTSGAIYAGAFTCFLALLAVFLVNNKLKPVLLTSTIFLIALSWGKNFPILTDFFIDNFPLYNKFRAVVSIMLIPLMLIPILALLCLQRLLKTEVWNENTHIGNIKLSNKKIIWGTLIILCSFCLLGIIFPYSINSFLSSQETSNLAQSLSQKGYDGEQIHIYIDSLVKARKSIFRLDSIRTLGILLIGGLFLWLYSSQKIKQPIFITLVGLLMVVDLFALNRRYLSVENYERKAKIETNYGIEPTENDKKILRDKDPHYRVLNLINYPFTESTSSFFHKSIGGYHPAKLRSYQDFIDYQITPDMYKISDGLNAGKPLQEVFSNTNALNMLNAKYIILNDREFVLNPNRLGNAWFINELKVVSSSNEEIMTISTINPKYQAIIRDEESEAVIFNKFNLDSSSRIDLVSYDPENMIYQSSNNQDGFAIFSEIYYPHWNAYIDGVKQHLFKVNYTLRGLAIPSGSHKITFKYEDTLYHSSGVINIIGCLIVLLGVPTLILLHFKYQIS